MELAKITARGRTTILKSIREAGNLFDDDVVAFEIEGDHLVAHKVRPGQDDYLQGLFQFLREWNKPEDEESWRDL